MRKRWRFKDSIKGPGISEEQIESARDIVELNSDTNAAKELLEFLESEKVKEALIE